MVENLGQLHLDMLDEMSNKIEKLDYEKICNDLEPKKGYHDA
jgi:hypothetical protein